MLNTFLKIERTIKILSIIFLVGCSHVISAAEDKSSKSKEPIPKEEIFTSKHEIKIGNSRIKYTATVGTMEMRDTEGKPIALFGYTAYVKDGGKKDNRPLLFAYNGGPGSASIWLHMGILGPQRTIVTDANFSPNGPFKRVSNKFSILDRADLVMIDPVGTGFSRPIGEGEGKDFWGVDQDIKSVSEFIVQYTTKNARWASPKYLLGESYGGMRSGGVVYHLLTKHNYALNGVVLVSPFMDYVAGFLGISNDLPHVLFFTTFAATAWYHKTIKNRPDDLQSFLGEAEEFATNVYAPALLKGNRLSQAEKRKVLEGMERYTGISATYWDRANMRIDESQFSKELLRDKKINSGRIDSRFLGESINSIGESIAYDPFFPSVGPAFVATFNDYYAKDLNVKTDQKYVTSAALWNKWDETHQIPGKFKVAFANTGVDLAHAMIMNPEMRVLVMQGYFDLATPYGATNYFLDHMNISEKLQKNIEIEYYQAGHMMYLHKPSMSKFKDDLGGFIK